MKIASRFSFSKNLLKCLSRYFVILVEGINVPSLALISEAGLNLMLRQLRDSFGVFASGISRCPSGALFLPSLEADVLLEDLFPLETPVLPDT